jgi:hypothetical protein
MLACEDSTSMLCARVVRGAASSAKAVRPAPARRCRPVGVEGVEHAHQHGAGFISASSAALGAHLQHQLGAQGAGVSVISAPAAS